jgi:hypothetical protein
LGAHRAGDAVLIAMDILGAGPLEPRWDKPRAGAAWSLLSPQLSSWPWGASLLPPHVE